MDLQGIFALINVIEVLEYHEVPWNYRTHFDSRG
jgi:hypothetical protein